MPVGAGDAAGLGRVLQAAADRGPLVFAHGTVRSLDAPAGEVADVVVDGEQIRETGPGLAAAWDGAVVVDCAEATLLPAAGTAAAGAERLGTLEPGAPATFAVLHGPAGRGPLEKVVWYTDRAAAMLVDGVVTLWDGRVVGPGTGELVPGSRTLDSARLGSWTDEAADVVQHLAPDGRYDETRSGRPRAFEGSFWMAGDHVVYRDDLGFWAYGRFRGDELHHAAFRFRRG